MGTGDVVKKSQRSYKEVLTGCSSLEDHLLWLRVMLFSVDGARNIYQ